MRLLPFLQEGLLFQNAHQRHAQHVAHHGLTQAHGEHVHPQKVDAVGVGEHQADDGGVAGEVDDDVDERGGQARDRDAACDHARHGARDGDGDAALGTRLQGVKHLGQGQVVAGVRVVETTELSTLCREQWRSWTSLKSRGQLFLVLVVLLVSLTIWEHKDSILFTDVQQLLLQELRMLIEI